MFIHSKHNETIIAAWAEPAEHKQLILIEWWLSIIKVGGFGICHFYLNQHMNLSSSESITKYFCYKWQKNWQEAMLYKARVYFEDTNGLSTDLMSKNFLLSYLYMYLESS